MQNRVSPKPTRFRAYQMECAGSSFSYWANDHFTLIEGIATECNQSEILAELKICGKSQVDCLHITSWDNDHCSTGGLEWILKNLRPRRIEVPGYVGTSDCAKESRKLIEAYRQGQERASKQVKVQPVDPPYIKTLATTKGWSYENVFYHPKSIRDKDNDNSTIKLFRSGSFNVLSLGDVEDHDIAAMLMRDTTLQREVDVLILAHHGADNGFTTKNFIQKLKPHVAIATCNIDNQHDHPRDAVIDILKSENVPTFTTKTGDIIVESTGAHTRYFKLTNIHHGSNGRTLDLEAKKFKFASLNLDAQRNILHRGNKGPR
jgi:competence protein ComEC